ncbi:circadian clock protein KaiB [Actinopolymorpha cephalotaxi]|uniref:Circadian clock protein KaiB n=1 Tax=Actinopolymorpha cephalotaxi TaxID=504797 RepID=A0A1I2ZS19_9ACTN|nr:circadian clock KaiB family protein [Actinopolymorpha cephalotaxi]NYH84137.1 circadian clock protein KaiB [Actinopolymorpha cephalotaxi]SFH40608.1 circadian clock protein KaiB [Actinopolymorpha cephalotaxi]
MTTYTFRLYVAGQFAERAETALWNLRTLCESRVPGRYAVELIDLEKRPEMAQEERILMTPTVIRTDPPPQRRVIGVLSDHQRAAFALGLPDADGRAEENTKI